MIEADLATGIEEPRRRLANTESVTLLRDEGSVEHVADCPEAAERPLNLNELSWPFFT